MWNEFADWGEDMGVNIAKVDVTEQPGKFDLNDFSQGQQDCAFSKQGIKDIVWSLQTCPYLEHH